MAFLKPAKSEKELARLTARDIKRAYKDVAEEYTHFLNVDYMYCHKCNEYKISSAKFYASKRFASGRFPICKDCLIKMAEQREKDSDPPNETRESVQAVLRFMDLPYMESLYQGALKLKLDSEDTRNGRAYLSAFQLIYTQLASLPQYKNLTWKDSVFNVEDKTKIHVASDEVLDANIIEKGRRRFGTYSEPDLMFLETEYEDWISRYECNTKAQEEAFQRLCWKKLEIRKATQEGKPTRDLDKTYQDWLGTANIQPKQTSMDALVDAQTLGTLLQKYEETRPLPEVDPELQDVDKLGFLIDTFFRGHSCKLLGIKNAFSDLYEKVMGKYTVKPPEYDGDEADSEDVFKKIFGDLEDY